MEEALVINWLTRAFARLLFILDVTGKSPKEAEAHVKQFAQSLTTRKIGSGTQDDQSLSVVKDIYIGRTMHEIAGKAYPGQTDVKVLDTSNTGFWNLSAIEYYQNKVITSLRIPKAHLGIERDVNAKSTLQQQDKRFVRMVRRIQQVLSGAITDTIDLQLALQGYNPSEIDYQLMWATPSWEDALEESRAVLNFASAAEKLMKNGLIDKELVQTRYLHMTDVEIKRANAEAKSNMATTSADDNKGADNTDDTDDTDDEGGA
jgi:hypothetical protein